MEDALREEGSYEILSKFIMYFEDTFIGHFTRQSDGTINDLPSTNKHIGGWHRAFCFMISCNHPNVFTFLLFFKKDQLLSDNKINGATLNSSNNHRQNDTKPHLRN
ncbi:hypothetical protein RF11_05239 [Thelohanellus kitauei]|uniref:Uncharacterized protein n=1 Tax=Thelohanellus kitauei TaxID=669202 RepID=A0A0C2MYM0_THEKT|nr:hypothetical protein RF11_05239 [Thelohanellus kitauei]